VVGKSVGEHKDDEGNSIWGGREEVLIGEGLSTEAIVHGEVPMEEAADGKLAVAAWTISRWRRMMGREGGQNSGGAS
jgi:hypothetical protein